MDDEQNNTEVSNFKLERYKFILRQIQFINENVYKYLTLFQTLITAILGGIATIFLTWQDLQLSVPVAVVGIRGLLGLVVILAIFVTVSIVAGVLSWVDYRREEVELLDEVVGPGFRKPTAFRNFWRWNETYLVGFTLAVVTVIYVFVETQVIPLIR